MSIETEYRGYTIRYNENSDEWNCYEARVSNVSLAKVKAKIDRLHLKMRKAAAFDCLYLGAPHGKPDLRDARAIDYRFRREKNYSSWTGEGPEFIEVHEVAVMMTGMFKDAPGKSWAKLESLAPLGPETDVALERVRQAQAEVEAAEARRKEAWAAVPRLTFEDVAALAEAADSKLDEADD